MSFLSLFACSKFDQELVLLCVFSLVFTIVKNLGLGLEIIGILSCLINV